MSNNQIIKAGLESSGKESSNSLEEYFRKERLIREKARMLSAAAHLMNIDKLIFETDSTKTFKEQQTNL